jgi:hypothetical protein
MKSPSLAGRRALSGRLPGDLLGSVGFSTRHHRPDNAGGSVGERDRELIPFSTATRGPRPSRAQPYIVRMVYFSEFGA